MISEPDLYANLKPDIEELWDLFLKKKDMRIYKEIQDRMKQKIEQQESCWL